MSICLFLFPSLTHLCCLRISAQRNSIWRKVRRHLFGYTSSVGGTKMLQIQLLALPSDFHSTSLSFKLSALMQRTSSSGSTLLLMKQQADCFYLGWIIEWDKKEHFISAGQIINHCHYLRLSGVADADPRLYPLNSFSVWRRRQPACIWIPDAFSGFSSACVWIGDYNLRLTTSLPHWRAERFSPLNWMWRHQMKNHFCLHAYTLIFLQCDAVTGWSDLTPEELLFHSCAHSTVSLSLYSAKLTPDPFYGPHCFSLFLIFGWNPFPPLFYLRF